MRYKTIGILGGMGPEATADLYLAVVRIFQQERGAKYDSDFPPFIICSLPLPDVVEGKGDEKAVVFMLKEGAKRLEAAGADFIAIACNTVHAYLPMIRQAVRIPILSIMEEVACDAAEKGRKILGLLATETTIRWELFDSECAKRGISLLKPDAWQQAILTETIMRVLSGRKETEDSARLLAIAEVMHTQGAEAVILGCTELPLLLKQVASPLPLLDTTEILARAIVRECR